MQSRHPNRVQVIDILPVARRSGNESVSRHFVEGTPNCRVVLLGIISSGSESIVSL